VPGQRIEAGGFCIENDFTPAVRHDRP
jgi:hypothetical protein